MRDREMIRVYVTNSSSGQSGFVEVAEGTTLGQLFEQQLRGKNSSNYRIRVNRDDTQQRASRVLNNGDEVSFTPVKIQGACLWTLCA